MWFDNLFFVLYKYLYYNIFFQNYNETTEEKKTVFESLKIKDEKSAKEIELQMRKLQRIGVNSFFINIRVSIYRLILYFN